MKLINLFYVLLFIGQNSFSSDGTGTLKGEPKPGVEVGQAVVHDSVDEALNKQLIKKMLEGTARGVEAVKIAHCNFQGRVLFGPLLDEYLKLKAEQDRKVVLKELLKDSNNQLSEMLSGADDNSTDVRIILQLLMHNLEEFRKSRDEKLAAVKEFHKQGLARLLKGLQGPEKGSIDRYVKDKHIILSHFGGVVFFPITPFQSSKFLDQNLETFASNDNDRETSYIILGMLADNGVIEVADLLLNIKSKVEIALGWIDAMKSKAVPETILETNKMAEQKISWWDFIIKKQAECANGHVDLNVSKKTITVDQGGSSSTTA